MAHDQNKSGHRRLTQRWRPDSSFVYCLAPNIRLIQYSWNCIFLNKEQFYNKLVVLQFFCAQQLRNANRMKMIHFHYSLNWLWRSNRKCRLSWTNKLFQGKSYSLFAFLLGARYMQKTSEFEFFSLAEESWFFYYCEHAL